MRKKRVRLILKKCSDVCLAAVLSVFILSLSVILTLGFRPLYYFDIGYLRIAEQTGYTREQIRENYDVLIDYNLSGAQKELVFPDFPMSAEGRIHFEEVKAIFQLLFRLLAASALLLAAGVLWKRKRGEYGYLLPGGIGAMTAALAAGCAFALDWERAFTLFHEMLFANDYWIFDPARDPVIDILPDAFFFHCALLILLLITLFSAVSVILWILLRRRGGKKTELSV